jgi:hypothetical protein
MDLRAKDEKQPAKYLLGEMTEAEQAQFEESFFHDVELSELVSDVENDLVDEYVREELSAGERERFERHFLVSERRREKVEHARALLQAKNANVASHVVVGRASLPWWKAVFESLRVPGTALSYSFGGVALVFLLGGLWLFSEVRQLRKETTRLAAERDMQSSQNEQLQEQVNRQRERSDELATQKEQLEGQLAELNQQPGSAERGPGSAPAFLNFILTPGSRGDDGPKKLIIPTGTRTVRLPLSLSSGDEYPAYQVKLQTASGSQIRNWNGLKATSAKGVRAVFVDVQASQLSGTVRGDAQRRRQGPR